MATWERNITDEKYWSSRGGEWLCSPSWYKTVMCLWLEYTSERFAYVLQGQFGISYLF